MKTEGSAATPATAPRDLRRRHRTWAMLAVIAAAFAACSWERTVTYDPARDDAAMAVIASAWTDGGALALSLCEDVARSAAWTPTDGCVVDHVVRGGGLGLAHTESHPEGACTMGGCLWDAAAYVVGTISGGALPRELAVAGEVWLDATSTDDPYAYPYRLEVACTDPETACHVSGTLREDGGLSARLALGAYPEQAETGHELSRTGAGVCP